MAEGTSEVRDSNEDDSVSENKETVDIICDLCKDDGNNIEAHGFCVDCNEYLCDNCFHYHLKPRPCRNHVLQDSTSMPKQKAKQTVDLEIKQLSACRIHPSKELTSFCKTHDELCCESCLSTCHCLCNDVVPIETVAAEEENKTAMEEFDESLSSVTKMYQENIEATSTNMIEIDEVYQDTMKHVEAKLKTIKTKDMEKVKDIKDKSETTHTQLVEWKRIREKISHNGSARESFIFRRNIEHLLTAISMNVEKLRSENSITRHSYIEAADLSGGELGEIGKIKLTPPFLVDTISIEHSDDEECCRIEEIAILPSGKLIMIDVANDSVKLVDRMSKSIKSRRKLTSSPWSMAVVNSNEVFITLPSDNAIVKLTSASEDVGQYTKISLPEQDSCSLVNCYNGQLTVLCSNNKVCVLDLSGKVVKTLHEDITNAALYEGKQKVVDPLFADVCAKSGSLYLTGLVSDSIVEVTQQGDVKVLVQSDKLQSPNGIFINTDETMFICSAGRKNILTVTKAGDILGPVLKASLPFNPRSLAFDQTTRQLYVAGKSDSMLVYQLK